MPVFQPVKTYIADLLNVSEDQIILTAHEKVEWPDSCLGAAQPGQSCMQVITPGYLVFFDTPLGPVQAHLDDTGHNFRLVEPPGAGPSPVAPGTSGITGQVLIGPVCPGPVRENQSCPDKPYPATITILDQAGQVVKQFQADKAGAFQESLPPGVYTLHPESTGAYPRAVDQEVTVMPGQFTRVQIVYDSGIR